MKSIDTLVSDIYELLDGKELLSSVERFQDDIGKMLLRRFENNLQDRKPSLRMSNLGKKNRQLWYEVRGYVPEKISGKTKFKFLYGDILETLLIFLAEASGHEVKGLQEEVEVDGVKGHIDCFIDGELVDVKSCSGYSFEKFMNGDLEGDPFGYIGQLSGYASALGKTHAYFVAIDKVAGGICLFKIETKDYDVKKRVLEVKELTENSTPPDRCYSPKPPSKTDKTGNLILDTGCAWCGHKEECWKDANNGTGLQIRWYSTGPRYFTSIIKEPRLNNEYSNNFPTKE